MRTGRTKAIVADAACVPAQLGVTCCPCRGHTDEEDYARVVETVRLGLTEDPRLLLEPLERRMHTLAGQERFEEAAITRDRVAALTRVLRRRQTLAWLSTSGQMSVALDDGVVTFDDGRLLLGDPELALGAAVAPTLDLDGSEPCRRTSIVVGPTSSWWWRVGWTGRWGPVVPACSRPPGHRAHRGRGALPRYEPAPRRGIRRGR